MFLTNSKSGREALKCALPPKTRQQEGIPLKKVWLRVASPYVRPFTRSTSSQRGVRSSYFATQHVKQRWSNKSAATLPGGATGEGECSAAPTNAATTPCSAAAKEWMVVLDIPKAASLGSVSGTIGYPLTPCVPHPPGRMPCGGE